MGLISESYRCQPPTSYVTATQDAASNPADRVFPRSQRHPRRPLRVRLPAVPRRCSPIRSTARSELLV